MSSVSAEKVDRIGSAFDSGRLAAQGKHAAFVSYVCAGDPDFDTSYEVLRRLVDAGADVLEIGVPFSDPLADGPTNQRASERALASGMNAGKVFALVEKVRSYAPSVAIVFYTYYNLVFSQGNDEYVRRAREAGVDGMLVLDLPPEESREHLECCARYGMKTVYIVSPATRPERIREIVKVASGFIYYVSREGVTGERSELAEGVDRAVSAIRKETVLPVVVGFGISTAQQVAETAFLADGVVVGSAIVRRCELLRSKGSEKELDAFSVFLEELVGGCASPQEKIG